ncbi:MAG: hypothetical protein CMO40_09010 [Verrucomicrobiaceae bacterium]|nr:hypothetical protein [Verrucomicrobiaceae bacterium]
MSVPYTVAALKSGNNFQIPGPWPATPAGACIAEACYYLRKGRCEPGSREAGAGGMRVPLLGNVKVKGAGWLIQ